MSWNDENVKLVNNLHRLEIKCSPEICVDKSLLQAKQPHFPLRIRSRSQSREYRSMAHNHLTDDIQSDLTDEN